MWSRQFGLDRKRYWWTVLFRLELPSIKQLVFWPYLMFNWTCIVKSKVEFSGRGDNVNLFTWHMFKRKVLNLGWIFFLAYDLLNYCLIKWLIGIWSLLNMLISFKYCSSCRKQQRTFRESTTYSSETIGEVHHPDHLSSLSIQETGFRGYFIFSFWSFFTKYY